MLNKNLNMNSLIKTAALCCILWQSVSGHGFKSDKISRRLVSNFAVAGVVKSVSTVIWAIWLTSSRYIWFSHRSSGLLGRVHLSFQNNEIVQKCLHGAQGFWIKCTYCYQRNTNKKKGVQAFIIGFSTEMFGDRLGMPWRSTSRSRFTGRWPLVYVLYDMSMI